MKKQCKTAGAIGGGISGSGPSIFMLSRDEPDGTHAWNRVMKSVYDRIGVNYHTYVTRISQQGVTCIA